MVVALGDVVEKLDLPAKHSDHHVDASIIIEVSKGHAAVSRLDLKIWSGRGTDVLKLGVAEVSEDGIRFRVAARWDEFADVVHHVGPGDKQVLPAIVVEVEHAVAPPRHP